MTTELGLWILDHERFPDRASVLEFLQSDDFDRCMAAIESAVLPAEETPKATAKAALEAVWYLVRDLRELHSIATSAVEVAIEHKPRSTPQPQSLARAALAVNAGIDDQHDAADLLLGLLVEDARRENERKFPGWKSQEATT